MKKSNLTPDQASLIAKITKAFEELNAQSKKDKTFRILDLSESTAIAEESKRMIEEVKIHNEAMKNGAEITMAQTIFTLSEDLEGSPLYCRQPYKSDTLTLRIGSRTADYSYSGGGYDRNNNTEIEVNLAPVKEGYIKTPSGKTTDNKTSQYKFEYKENSIVIHHHDTIEEIVQLASFKKHLASILQYCK